jgi:hypothetical protein
MIGRCYFVRSNGVFAQWAQAQAALDEDYIQCIYRRLKFA